MHSQSELGNERMLVIYPKENTIALGRQHIQVWKFFKILHHFRGNGGGVGAENDAYLVVFEESLAFFGAGTCGEEGADRSADFRHDVAGVVEGAIAIDRLVSTEGNYIPEERGIH